MSDQTSIDVTCAFCGEPAAPLAPFCVLCGHDPLTGEAWAPEGGTEAIGALLERASGDDGVDGLSLDELAELVVFHAYAIGSAEVHAVVALGRRRGGFNVVARLGADRRRTRELHEAFAWLVPNVGALRVVLGAFFERLESEHPGTGPDELEMLYPGAAFVLQGHFPVYLDATGEAMLWDAFSRFVGARAARSGASVPETWAPEDGAFRVSYNGLVYTALPARALRRAMGATALPGGPDGFDGELVVALVPAPWRCWFDLAFAPWATLGVYAQSDPRAGIEGLAVTTDELCAEYAAYVADRYEPTADVRATEIGGHPAVRATVRLGARPDPDDEFGIFDDAVVEHAWVHAGTRVWHLYGWAPERGRVQYLRALREAIETFECAA